MMLGGFDANLTALLSAHQSIGVPQPLIAFGTDSQKRRFLPRCAKGEISARIDLSVTGASKAAVEAVEKAGGSLSVTTATAAE